jgi:hypothetical protein
VRLSSQEHLQRADLAQRRGRKVATLARQARKLAAEAAGKAADAEHAASVQLTDPIRRLYKQEGKRLRRTVEREVRSPSLLEEHVKLCVRFARQETAAAADSCSQ